MTVWLKQGVCGEPHREIRRAIGKLGKLYATHVHGLRITSLAEGNHMDGSLHYDGYAVDFEQLDRTLEEIRRTLGPGYDVVGFVVGGRQCVHVEWDPKGS